MMEIDVKCGDWVKLMYTGGNVMIPYRLDGTWLHIRSTEGQPGRTRRFSGDLGYICSDDISAVERGGHLHMARGTDMTWQKVTA
jgi:hypothetical protein